MMRICYIIDSAINNGGAPTSTHIIAKEAAKRGIETFLVMPECADKTEKDSRICYCEMTMFKEEFPWDFAHPIGFIRLVIELNKMIKKINPDLIHAQMPRGARAVSVLKKMGKLSKKIKLVYTDREYVVDLKSVYKYQYQKTIASNYDEIVCLSESAVCFWKLYLPQKKIHVIPNPGGELFDVYSIQDYKISEKSHSELVNGKVNIIMVGRMTWEKRWDLAKSVILTLNERYANKINFILVISYKNAKMKDEALNYVRKFEKVENVFIYQNITMEEISQLYYLSDIHLITSCRESFGRTAIEAMSRKNIILSTEAGAIRETIGMEEYMLSDNIEMIVTTAGKYIEDTAKMERGKEQFFKRYCERYMTDANTQAHIDLYLKVLRV